VPRVLFSFSVHIDLGAFVGFTPDILAFIVARLPDASIRACNLVCQTFLQAVKLIPTDKHLFLYDTDVYSCDDAFVERFRKLKQLTAVPSRRKAVRALIGGRAFHDYFICGTTDADANTGAWQSFTEPFKHMLPGLVSVSVPACAFNIRPRGIVYTTACDQNTDSFDDACENCENCQRRILDRCISNPCPCTPWTSLLHLQLDCACVHQLPLHAINLCPNLIHLIVTNGVMDDGDLDKLCNVTRLQALALHNREPNLLSPCTSLTSHGLARFVAKQLALAELSLRATFLFQIKDIHIICCALRLKNEVTLSLYPLPNLSDMEQTLSSYSKVAHRPYVENMTYGFVNHRECCGFLSLCAS